MQQRATYQIPCHDCDFSNIGKTKCSFSIHKKEHLAGIWHIQFDKSALTNHVYDKEHFSDIFPQKNIPWIGPTPKF